MPVWICSAEITDNCTNNTVWGVRMNHPKGSYVCAVCRPFVRRSVVKIILFGNTSTEDKDGEDSQDAE